jgi:hypothetical protein
MPGTHAKDQRWRAKEQEEKENSVPRHPLHFFAMSPFGL